MKRDEKLQLLGRQNEGAFVLTVSNVRTAACVSTESVMLHVSCNKVYIYKCN